VQSIAAKSIVSAHSHLSQMSRVSSKVSSVATSQITGLSQATSHLTDFLATKLFIDEYGFTDKACRHCGNKLAIEEVIALSIPLDPHGVPLCKIEDIKFEDISYICLSCYAE
jgi:ribosomal protein L40E